VLISSQNAPYGFLFFDAEEGWFKGSLAFEHNMDILVDRSTTWLSAAERKV